MRGINVFPKHKAQWRRRPNSLSPPRSPLQHAPINTPQSVLNTFDSSLPSANFKRATFLLATNQVPSWDLYLVHLENRTVYLSNTYISKAYNSLIYSTNDLLSTDAQVPVWDLVYIGEHNRFLSTQLGGGGWKGKVWW